MNRFRQSGVQLSKIHLSSALSVHPTLEVRQALAAFADDIYFHQVIERQSKGTPGAIAIWMWLWNRRQRTLSPCDEWRIHFHIPLHSQPTALFGNTSDHLAGVLDRLRERPALCSHFEMETYTWEVMPAGNEESECRRPTRGGV